jgi:hypothetical protein
MLLILLMPEGKIAHRFNLIISISFSFYIHRLNIKSLESYYITKKDRYLLLDTIYNY